MVIDTAAGASVVYPDLIASLGLKAGEKVAVQGASGVSEVAFYPLASLAVGARARDVNAVGLPRPDKLAGTEGVVGMDFLKEAIVEFDAPNGRLLWRDAPIAEGGSWLSVPFTSRGGFVVIDGRLDGLPTTVILDTGAAQTVANPSAGATQAAKSGATAGTARSVSGVGAGATSGTMRDFTGLMLGNVSLPADAILVADLPVFAALGLKDRPTLVLGFDRLRSIRFVVDYRSNVISFAVPGSAK